jgi:hypothetical protein
MIRKFAGHDTETPPGTIKYSEESKEPPVVKKLEDYIAWVQEAEGLTKTENLCYTITTGMSLRDFKDGLGQAYWNRDRETLDRLLESLQEGA